MNLDVLDEDLPPKVAADAPLAGKTVVITGTIADPRSGEKVPRPAFERLAERAGATTASAVSANTDMLITGANVGATKTAKAEKLGVEVVDQEARLAPADRRGGSLTGGMRRRTVVLLSLLGVVGVLFIAGVLNRAVLTDAKDYRVPSESMVPTVQLGDRVTLDLGAYEDAAPEIGDIVIHHPPLGAEANECGEMPPAGQMCARPTPERVGRLVHQARRRRSRRGGVAGGRRGRARRRAGRRAVHRRLR